MHEKGGELGVRAIAIASSAITMFPNVSSARDVETEFSAERRCTSYTVLEPSCYKENTLSHNLTSDNGVTFQFKISNRPDDVWGNSQSLEEMALSFSKKGVFGDVTVSTGLKDIKNPISEQLDRRDVFGMFSISQEPYFNLWSLKNREFASFKAKHCMGNDENLCLSAGVSYSEPNGSRPPLHSEQTYRAFLNNGFGFDIPPFRDLDIFQSLDDEKMVQIVGYINEGNMLNSESIRPIMEDVFSDQIQIFQSVIDRQSADAKTLFFFYGQPDLGDYADLLNDSGVYDDIVKQISEYRSAMRIALEEAIVLGAQDIDLIELQHVLAVQGIDISDHLNSLQDIPLAERGEYITQILVPDLGHRYNFNAEVTREDVRLAAESWLSKEIENALETVKENPDPYYNASRQNLLPTIKGMLTGYYGSVTNGFVELTYDNKEDTRFVFGLTGRKIRSSSPYFDDSECYGVYSSMDRRVWDKGLYSANLSIDHCEKSYLGLKSDKAQNVEILFQNTILYKFEPFDNVSVSPSATTELVGDGLSGVVFMTKARIEGCYNDAVCVHVEYGEGQYVDALQQDSNLFGSYYDDENIQDVRIVRAGVNFSFE